MVESHNEEWSRLLGQTVFCLLPMGYSRWADSGTTPRKEGQPKTMYAIFPEFLVPSTVPTNCHEAQLVQPSFQSSASHNYFLFLLSCLSPDVGQHLCMPLNPSCSPMSFLTRSKAALFSCPSPDAGQLL